MINLEMKLQKKEKSKTNWFMMLIMHNKCTLTMLT
jgi:hypothetical protein